MSSYRLKRMKRRLGNTGRSEGYSGLRSGLVDFTESAIGLGDELDAGIRTLTGEADSFSEGLKDAQRDLDYFERNNKVASGALDVLGIGSSLLIPGLGAAKIAQTGSRVARAVKVGTLAAAEGAAYGYATGRGEDRLESAKTGAMFGGAIGGAMGGFLTKNADDLAKAAKVDDAKKIGRGTFFGGEEGFDRTIKAAKEKGAKQTKVDTSAKARKINSVDRDAIMPDDLARSPAKDTVDAIALNTRAWGVKNVGERFTRLVEDGESGIRRAHVAIDDTFDALDSQFRLLADDLDMKEGLLNLGKKPTSAVRARFGLADDAVMKFDDVAAKAKSPEQAEALRQYGELLEETRLLDFDDWVKAGEWAPRKGGAASADGVGVLDAYGAPSEALRDYAKDITDAQVLMKRFGLESSDIVKKRGEQSRLDAVIDAVEKKLAAEATDDIAANGANLMRSVYVGARTGGDAMGAMARKMASTGLLANPINAVLNLGEAVTAPVYQNGIRAWAATMPKLVKSSLSKKLGTADQKYFSQHQLGIEKQFAGELMSEGKSTLGKWLDWGSEGLYKYTGTSLSHRVGQEALANSAIKRADHLIQKGNLSKLRRHPGMAGLSQQEFDSTVAALTKLKKVGLDKLDPTEQSWVLNFSGAAMNKWQAISALSMPKAFLDNPNGRIGYSMLSYMNVNMNNLRTDVGLNLMEVAKYGLNSKQGQAAFKKASLSSVKYAALFGVFAGIWDDMRKTMDLTNDKELGDVFTFDGVANAALNQFASNMSSGLVNIRAEEFGGDKVQLMPAPISLGLKGANAAADALTGDLDPALRFAQQAVPGISQADRLSRMGMLSSVGITNKPEKLFESLGLLD